MKDKEDWGPADYYANAAALISPDAKATECHGVVHRESSARLQYDT